MSDPFRQILNPFTFSNMAGHLREVATALPDPRVRTGPNTRYTMQDVALGAFSVFFTQSPSFLAVQKTLRQRKGRSNARTLFQMDAIPCDNQIRKLLDEVPPDHLSPVFTRVFEGLEAGGHLDGHRVLGGDLLIALDGTQYHSSQRIHCGQCSECHHRNGTVTYSHQALTPVVVAPGKGQVVPLVPEFITPQDGHDKQDCENAAAKRWLAGYARRYSVRGVTILGDDLYCHQPLCESILQAGFGFILTCKPESHTTLYEWVAGAKVGTLTVRRWTGRRHETDTYRFLNQVPLRDGEDALLVNWCELTTTTDEGEVVYRNAFATDRTVDALNVATLVACGRTRWKIENENNNTLKTKGYHFEHNYGHGKHHLATVLAALMLLAFLFHTVLEWTDVRYRLLRSALPGRRAFFDDLRALTRYICFTGWDALLSFMLEGLEMAVPDTG